MGWRPDLENDDVRRIFRLMMAQAGPYEAHESPFCSCGHCPMDVIDMVDMTVERTIIVTSHHVHIFRPERRRYTRRRASWWHSYHNQDLMLASCGG